MQFFHTGGHRRMRGMEAGYSCAYDTECKDYHPLIEEKQ